MIDLCRDAHVHTAFSAGRDSVSVLVGAGEQAGLTEMIFADRVSPDCPWLPSYLASINRAQRRTDLILKVGIEVEAIGIDGWLAFPLDLTGLEIISVGLGRLPLPTGPVGPQVVRSLLKVGTVTVDHVVEQFVSVTCLAVERASRYAPTLLARPLDLLARAGISESMIPNALMAELVQACRRHGTIVEVSERYKTPSATLAGMFIAAGVPLVAASDARRGSEIGQWAYVDDLISSL